jgi:hypothetical protein
VKDRPLPLVIWAPLFAVAYLQLQLFGLWCWLVVKLTPEPKS